MARLTFHEGDICSRQVCEAAIRAEGYVCHLTALGSVPRSLADPMSTHGNYISFFNMFVAGRDAKVTRFTCAASSSTYGGHPVRTKVEENIGKPLSPYAVPNYVNELYADVFAKTYHINTHCFTLLQCIRQTSRSSRCWCGGHPQMDSIVNE